MIAVACGMEDDEANDIDRNYASYKMNAEMEGAIVMSEFEYINLEVVGNNLTNRARKSR